MTASDKLQKAMNMSGGLSYREGDRVRHIKFGEGIVVKLVNTGDEYEVTVNFDKAGVKKMKASFAKLTRI